MVNIETVISIILPVYNGAKYLHACIQSIFDQTFKDWELIIIDDYSDDNSYMILEEYCIKDSRIILLRNDSKKGLSYSLNKALEYAGSNYIARIDADDIMLPNRLKFQLEFLKNNLDYGMVASRVEFIDSNTLKLGVSDPITELLLKKKFGKNNPIFHSSTLIRRSILSLVGNYNPRYNLAEDYDLWLRIYKHSKIKVLPEILTKYRIHEQNTSILFEKTQLFEFITITFKSYKNGTLDIKNLFNLWRKMFALIMPQIFLIKYRLIKSKLNAKVLSK